MNFKDSNIYKTYNSNSMKGEIEVQYLKSLMCEMVYLLKVDWDKLNIYIL